MDNNDRRSLLQKFEEGARRPVPYEGVLQNIGPRPTTPPLEDLDGGSPIRVLWQAIVQDVGRVDRR